MIDRVNLWGFEEKSWVVHLVKCRDEMVCGSYTVVTVLLLRQTPTVLRVIGLGA